MVFGSAVPYHTYLIFYWHWSFLPCMQCLALSGFISWILPFYSVSRSHWIRSPQEPLSLRSSSPCALLFMKAGPKELYMQMLRASCIPPRLGLCASTARLGSVCCPCRLLREMDVPDSEIPTLSLRCLPWDEMTFKAVGTHGPLAGVVIQAHIISVQLKVDVIPIIWGFQSTNDDGTMVGFWLGCPN